MSNFVDECNFCARAGDGGFGCVSFRREAHVPYGGPDGGDGGDGGSVWLEADRSVVSLLGFRDHPHRIAKSGVHGQGSKKHGKRGEDLIVKVPEGTIVYDRETEEMLVDLAAHGDRWCAARGGEGGKGNARFLSNKRRAPDFAEQGEKCEDTWFRLELKLMADVALVGYPSVGKSTLISVISKAKPKIADYPFTTLEPNLGVVSMDSETQYVVADLPGLIEGAHEGHGLGFRFLRHIERARVLVYMLDLSLVDGDTPARQLEVLRRELERYKPELLERPSIVVASKEDMLTVADWSDPALDEVVEFSISSLQSKGLTPVLWRMAQLVKESKDSEPPRRGFVTHRPEPSGVRVERDVDGAWIVRGREAERAVALSDMGNILALDHARAKLNKIGVDKALRYAGVKEGEEVRIGGFVFEYYEDL